MVKKGLLFGTFFSLFWSTFVVVQVNQSIINHWGGGRFGDRITSYVIAKWVSFKFNIPFLLDSFQHSSMLRFGREEKKYSSKLIAFKFNIPLLLYPRHALSSTNAIIPKKFEGIIRIEHEQNIIEHEQENVIFEISAPDFHIDGCSGVEEKMEYILQDQYFAAEIKKMLQPIIPLPKITLPKDKITVAVHVRKGGGYDPPLSSIQYYTNNMQDSQLDVIDSDIDMLASCCDAHNSRLDVIHYYQNPSSYYSDIADKKWPPRFPPEQYYVDQIKRISKLFDNAPLFIHIFTDDQNPSRLVNKIKKEVNKDNITFSCRSHGNMYNLNVIEDFYNMSRFDCLIRPASHFSLAAQLLGDHKIIIYPKHWKWVGKKLIIDEVSIIDNRVS